MSVPEIDVLELAELRAGGVPLIDVRRVEEYKEFHVPGAVLVPLDEVVERAAEIPKDQRVYVICAAGGRSRKAAEYLNQQGYDTVNVAGGSNGWREAGLPVVEGSEAG
jgi:rhodanese-related sulfurtransferase